VEGSVSDDYRSRVRDADFKTQYDATPKDVEVDALLRGIEPPREAVTQGPPGPRMTVIEPAPQFTWLKPLR
jgi:hypothetical protein